MTDLTSARTYLEQYQAAMRDLDYYASRIESLEARIMRGSSAPDQHAGWTGEYTGRAKDGRGWIVTQDASELVKAWRVMAIPKASQGTHDPKAGERLLVALADQQIEYERKACDAAALCREIEASIDRYTTGTYALALKYRYIEELTYPQISERMNYSVSQVRRLVDEGLTRYSEKMTRFSRNGAPTCDIM